LSFFQAVSGAASDDVWAVGTNAGLAPLIEHWNGQAWTQVPQPESRGDLFGVAAVSGNDAWAVGYTDDQATGLIERWDGTAWSVVPSPQPGATENWLSAVAAISSTDVWAAGRYSAPDGSIQPLYEHWNGTAWSQVKPPAGTKTSGGVIHGLTALASNDVWAVGYTGAGGFNFAPLAEHWYGGRWHLVNAAPVGTGVNQFRSVYGAASNDVWAVGTTTNDGFVQHWDGSTWQLTQTLDSAVWGVSGSATDDVWAVGIVSGPAPYAEHWDGTTWTQVPAPNPGLGSTELGAVDALSSTDVWAVGSYNAPSSNGASPAAMYSKGVCG
jgi:hypothetical protein